MPATISESGQFPVLLQTLIASNFASGATPIWDLLEEVNGSETAIPATWVPWPLSSRGLLSLLKKSWPAGIFVQFPARNVASVQFPRDW